MKKEWVLLIPGKHCDQLGQFAYSVPNKAQQIIHHNNAGAANKNAEPRNHKLYLSQILFGSVEKIVSESVYLRVFPLLGDILWWGNIRNHWKMFGTYWTTCDRQVAAQIRDLDHWGKSWWLVYLTLMIGYVWICVSIHVFLHICRPMCVMWIMFTSLKPTKATLAGVAEIHHICSVSALCSARPKGCKANMNQKDQKAAITEKWSVKTTWFLPIEDAFFIHKYC